MEDQDRKAEALIEIANSVCQDWIWTIERTFNSAMRSLYLNDYDVVLLDVTLPCFDEGLLSSDNPSMNLAGRDIIREIELGVADTKVIVVTLFRSFAEAGGGITFEDLEKDLRDACPRVFAGMVQFEYDSEQWKQVLGVMLTEITA